MADANGPQKRKRGRLATACSECRRLKLKCNAKVPCDQCMKRGVGQVCPNATLIPRKGRRFVLSSTKELHDKVDVLTERIIALENALMSFNDKHPLLTPELIALKFAAAESPPLAQPAQPEKTTEESIAAWVQDDAARLNTIHAPSEEDKLHQELEEAFGTLTIRPSGDAAFLGKTARAEFLIHANISQNATKTQGQYGRLSSRLTESCYFMDYAPDPRVVAEVYSFLPPFTEALRLCENYVRHGGIGYTPLLREEVFDEVMATVYNTDPSKQPGHQMVALIFSMFALGALFDENRPARSMEAYEYFILARVAIEFDPPWRLTTLESIQALLHIAQFFELNESDPLPSNMSWVYTGLSMRLAQSIGLHLNADRWNLPPGQLQKRNRLFWSIFAWDIHISLNFGRPPTLSPNYIDCPEPLGEEVVNESGEKEIGFSIWASKFSLVLHEALGTIFGVATPTYQRIIDTDRDLRNFEIPKHLKICPSETNTPKVRGLQQGYVLGLKEIALMNLHRSYLAQALREAEAEGGVNLLKHKFAASVMSSYRSAWRVLQALNLTWHRSSQPALARLPIPWSHGLSATIVLCLIVSRAPNSKLTKPALEMLDLADALYTEASQKCLYASNNLGCVRALRLKAYASAQHLVYFSVTCPLSTQELERITGHTHLLVSGEGTESSSSSSQHSPYATSGDDSFSSPPPVTSDSLEDMLGEVYIGSTLFPNIPVDGAMEAQHMHPTIMHDMTFFSSSPKIPERQFSNSNYFPQHETIPSMVNGHQEQYFVPTQHHFDSGPTHAYFYDEGHFMPNGL